MIKIKKLLSIVLTITLIADFLVSGVVTQLFPLLPSVNSSESSVELVAYAQGQDTYVPVLSPARGVFKGGLTGTNTEYCVSMGVDEPESCYAKTGDIIKYLIEVNLSGKDTQTFGTPTAGISVTDHVGEGICITTVDNPFGSEDREDSCEGQDITLEYTEDLQESENKTVEGDGGFDIINTPTVITEGLNNDQGSEQDKIYGYNNGGTLKVWYLTRNGQSKQYQFNGITRDASDLGPSNTPASTNAIGGNHNLTKACIGKNAIFGQNDSTIECFFPDVNQASLQMINYPVVLDIEVTDAGTVVAIVTDTNGNNFKCDDASNLSSCQAVSSDRIYIDSADTAQSTSAYQFYEHFNHTIEIDNDKVASNTYPEQDSPARSVGLGNELPNGKKFILWNNSSDGNLYIYPGVSENVGGSSYKINGTISAGYVLGGFEGDLSDFDSYTVYKNASCSGTPSINEQTLENAYTNIVAEIDNDSLNVYEGDYCITFQGTPNNDGQSVTVYQNRLNYMTTVEGNIDPETEENKVTNTISETIPTNLKPTPVWHDFLLTTGTTTFEISKSVSGNQVTGYAFGDEAVFNIEIIASGSTSSSDLFIVDTLSGSVLDWVSTDVSEVVSVTGDTENCIIKDSEIEGNKITVQLSGGILAGEENKCQIVLKTEFKGYGCFTNDTNTIKSHYGALNSENIPLQGSGVTVCSVGLDNLKLEKYILNTGASDYNAITESTTELFHDGDSIFWLIKWKVDPDAELGNEDPQTTSNDAFVLHDVTLQDSMSGLERANVPTVEGSPIDPGDGYIAPWILGNLTGGTNGYIVIRGIVASGTASTFTNTIKFVGIQDPAIQATATGQYTGTSASGSVCTLTASMGGGNGTGGSGGGVNFNCVAHNSILGPYGFTISAGTASTGIANSSQNSFAGILMGAGNPNNPGGGAVQDITVTCTYTGSNGGGTCSTVITSTGTQNTNPPIIGNSNPPSDGSSTPGQCDPKGPCDKKPKEPQASDFSEGATVPYELGIENTDPNTPMEGITFWDELPAGMSMYEWKASIDNQIVKQGNKNGAKGRVDLTPDLVGVSIPSGKMLVIRYNTKIDSGYNFGSFINPATALYECEDTANPGSGSGNNNNPPSGGNSAPANQAGGGAENMVGGTGGLPTQSSPLPGPGTGANAGTVSTGGNENLLCIPTLYDISVTKKILSEKIEVGKSLKFEITVRNEGLKTVTGLVIKDQFSGLANVKLTSAASGIVAGYFTNATTGEFNIASGITLVSGQTITIVVDSVLSGTSFVNMVQACGYDDASDPDSDSCNGYDKLEDDSSVVSGNINTASFGDRIWYDTNGDGLQTTGEKGVNDLVVQLIMCGTDVVIGSGVKTNGDGNYTFNNLVPGKYAIRFDLTTLPAGFTLTAKNVGTDDSIDSDSDKVEGKYAISECITLTGGQSYLGHDLGIVVNGSGLSQLSLSKELLSSGQAMTSGSKLLFKITAGNDGVYGQSGIQIKDKWLGLTGIKVGLSQNSLSPVTAAGTDVVIRSGITLGGTGSTGGLILGASGANQFIIYVEGTLISGAFSNYAQLCNYDVSKELQKPPYPNKPCDNSTNQADDDVVSGSTIAGNLGDFVREDINLNGIQNIGEKGVKNIDLELYTCTNTTTKLASAKTDANGLYKFQGIAAGQYKIKIVLTGENSKYTLTTPTAGSDVNKDSNGLLADNLTECITVSGGVLNNTIDFGLILSTPDIKVTKTVQNTYVNVGDTAIYTVTLENIGSGAVKQYVFTDTLASGLSLDGLNTNDKIALSSGSVATCGSPSDGWKFTTITGNTSIVGNMMAANIQAGQKCIFTIKAKVTAATGAQLNNSITVSAIPDETNTANNSANVLVYPLPLCDLIQLSGDAGNAPFMLNYAIVPANPGTVRLLDSNQNSIFSSQNLNGSFNIINPGIYYIEYYTGANPPTTGVACIRPVVVKSLAECTNVTATATSDTSYNVVCQGNYANQYKLQMWYETTGATKTWIQAPNGIINSNQGNFTFPRNNQQMNYKFTCTINSGVNYGLDKITPYNGSINQFECAYKNKPDGKICAVQTLVAPLKVPEFNSGTIAQLPDPIEYCTAQETSTSTCVVGNVSAMLIKNYNTCEKLISYDLPDLLVTKSADKAGFATGEVITYTIDVKNIGSGVAKGVKLQDKIIGSFKIEGFPTNAPTTSGSLIDYTDFYWNYANTLLNPGQNIQFKYTVKLLNANIEQISNTAAALVATGFETNYANNVANLTIGKQGDAKIGDLVWLDVNKNGIKDDNERGIKDLQVQLIGCNDVSPKLITKTDANGFYQFMQIGSGSYRVMVQVPDTYRVSPRNVGSFDKDSNLDPLTNVTECFSIANGQIKFDVDAGLFIDPTIPPQNPYCGNKTIEPQYGEQCDGNAVAGDSSCQNCQIIKNSLAICGNSIREPGEECEVGDVPNGKTCYNCKLTTNSVCGDGKVTGKDQGGYEECDINSPAKPGYQCIGCIEVPNSLATCGNGRQELGEACDLGSANGTDTPIPSGAYAGKRCTASCNVVNKIGDVILTYEPPSCTEIDPPSAMEGEYFPFWWDIDDKNVVTSCTQSGQILRDSMRCYFDLYAGKAGTNNPIQSIETNCYNTNQFQGNLLDGFNADSASKFGRYSFLLDPAKIANRYGEYKLRLKRINYQVCSGSGTVNGTIAPFNTFNDSYDETICEYNFTVSRPYLMQEGGLLSSNATDSLNNFYGFSSNAGTQSILRQYGVSLQTIGLNEFVGSQNINYLMDDFARKYTLLGVENINLGANTLKVPGKEIYIFDGNYTYNESNFTSGKPKTIVVANGNLNIVGNVNQNTLFVVPQGNIIIGTNNCNVPQTIYGIYLTKGSILSDKNYINNNLSNDWCEGGNLVVRGLLVGSSIQDLVSKRRSTLDDWFLKGNKKDAIINGASVLIKSNDRLFTEPAPGLEEFTKELNAYKR